MLALLNLEGEMVDEYRLTTPIGEGSFGFVYKAEVAPNGIATTSPAAVKILKSDLDEDRALLLREVEIMRACKHENVIDVRSSGYQHLGKLKNHFFIAMELADESLESALKRQPLSISEARTLAQHVCQGLVHIHQQNKVHRDLKPANVLKVGDTWKISDFGIARDAGYLRTQSRIGGTPIYTPPETGTHTLAPSFDMWSFGCLLHECLTGKPPIESGTPFKEPQITRIDDPILHGIVRDCLRHNAQQRITAADCLLRLDPHATPAHPRFNTEFRDCLLCNLKPDEDCARPLLTGTLADVKKGIDGYECLIFSNSDLEGQRLLLTDSWDRDLGERLHASWPTLKNRRRRLTLSAFHLFAHEGGYRANDKSLVIVDPQWLVSASDVREVYLCDRQQYVDRYNVLKQNEYLILGNVVNDLLPEIWTNPDVPETRQRQELSSRAEEIAQISSKKAQYLAKDVANHVRQLGNWSRKFPRHGTELKTETTVISPELGLKGRTDAMVKRGEELVSLAELKTGNNRHEDKLQLASYAIMLEHRNQLPATARVVLLYSKPNTSASLETFVELSPELIRETIVARNRVLLVDSSSDAPFNTSSCEKCFSDKKAACTLLAHLTQTEDPRPIPLRTNKMSEDEKKQVNERLQGIGSPERAFFQTHQAKILEEMHVVKSHHALLWACTSEQRERDGVALKFRQVIPVGVNGTRHTYGLVVGRGINQSQIQVDHLVSLYGSQGPTHGRVIKATVVNVDGDGIEIECDEPLTFTEGWASNEIDDQLIEREFKALYEFVVRPGTLRDVIVNERPPSFDPAGPAIPLPEVDHLNDEQRAAVELSTRMRDYLLVLGPPGAGKTTLLATLVKTQLAMGRRILVSANSNRALDQVVRTLIKAGLGDLVLRLGAEKRMAEDVRKCSLDRCYSSAAPLHEQVAAIRGAFATRRIVAATASHLANGEFEPLLTTTLANGDDNAAPRPFDLVIIDEASQVSLPLSLGPLRYGQRCVLVGDPNQLSPIRQSRPIAEAGEPSLFEVLAERVFLSGGEGLVELRHQYRMNAVICSIPSEMWYKGTLKPGTPAVAEALLDLEMAGLPAHVKQVLDPNLPVVFVDVPPDFAGERMNLAEARWAGDIVSALHACDPSLLDPARQNDRLGILAPYRAQVACMRRELSERLPKSCESRHWVDTVDRFQGGERDIMVISLVGARNSHVPDHLRDHRRLNVALSRARHKLVLLGDHDLLMRDALFAELFAVMARVAPGYRLRLERP